MLRWRTKLLSCNGSSELLFSPSSQLDACLCQDAMGAAKSENLGPRLNISNMRVAAAHAKMPADLGKRVEMVLRKFCFVFTAVVLIAIFAIGSFLFSRHARASQAQTASPAQPSAAPVAVSASDTPGLELPPGTIRYTPKANMLAILVARKYLTESLYMTVPEFEAAIRKANNGKSAFKKNEEVLVPGIEPQPVVEKSVPFPRDGEIRAI